MTSTLINVCKNINENPNGRILKNQAKDMKDLEVRSQNMSLYNTLLFLTFPSNIRYDKSSVY